MIESGGYRHDVGQTFGHGDWTISGFSPGGYGSIRPQCCAESTAGSHGYGISQICWYIGLYPVCGIEAPPNDDPAVCLKCHVVVVSRANGNDRVKIRGNIELAR